MFLCRWRSCCDAAAKASLSTPAVNHVGFRGLHTTAPLLAKTKKAQKRRRHTKVQPHPSPKVSTSAAEVSQLLNRELPGPDAPRQPADASLSASASTAPSTSSGASPPLLRPALAKSIQEKEKELLAYFGRARHHFDVVPLHKATAALQWASNEQAARVPLATLFPAPAAAAACATLHHDEQSVKDITGQKDETPASSNSSMASLPALHAAAFAAPNLFVGYSAQLKQCDDLTVSRMLNNRFGNSVDGNKFFGYQDMPLKDIVADVTDLWAHLGVAWSSLVQHSTAQRPAAPLPGQQSVCFVVFYAESQQTFSVGSTMHAMAQGVLRRCQGSRRSAAQVFAVVPIYVGLHAQPCGVDRAAEWSSQRSSTAVHGLGESGADDLEREPGIEYPSGGLYTCAAVVQCLSRLQPHRLAFAKQPLKGGREAKNEAGQDRVYSLDTRVFLVSDTWLHARSLADLYSHEVPAIHGGDASDRRMDDVDALDGELAGRDDAVGNAMLSFISEESRRHVHVFPAVVSNRVSATEQKAFTTHLWNMIRQV